MYITVDVNLSTISLAIINMVATSTYSLARLNSLASFLPYSMIGLTASLELNANL